MRVDESTPAPAHAREPGVRRRDRRDVRGWRDRTPPAIEPASRRGRIDPARRRKRSAELRQVPPGVLKDVGERAAHLGGRSKDPRVVAVGEHRAPTAEDPIHCPRDARTDRTHAVRQGRSVRGLDEQVQMVLLHGVVEQAKPTAVARVAEAPLDLANEAAAAERRYVGSDSQRHVTRVPGRENRPLSVGHATLRPGLASGTIAATAPAEARAKRQVLLTARRLDSSAVLGHAADCAARV